MYTFPNFIRELRKESGLTQSKLADLLGVSTILISMVEANQKKVSKKLIEKLANKLNVNPKILASFVFAGDFETTETTSLLEKKLIRVTTKLQKELIIKKAKLLINEKQNHF